MTVRDATSESLPSRRGFQRIFVRSVISVRSVAPFSVCSVAPFSVSSVAPFSVSGIGA